MRNINKSTTTPKLAFLSTTSFLLFTAHFYKFSPNSTTVRDFTGCTSDMIFNIPFLISHLSQTFTLERYDVILTGSPGIGLIKFGDVITAGIDDVVSVEFKVE